MRIELSHAEARVIACLMEKQVTTPEQYPLSLNALTAACNQKSNREPVMQLDEGEVQQVLDGLLKRRLVIDKTGFGSRVPKYQHRFCNTEFATLRLTEQEFGLICVLLLRGPQTPGELRGRTVRLCRFEDVHEVESVLGQLMQREDGPFVARLPREPGRRESRYAHLFCGAVQPEDALQADSASAVADTEAGRLAQLEARVEELHAELAGLKGRIDRLERND